MSAADGRREAVVLFAHGARDPAWTAPLERLADLLSGLMPGTVVARAFLELQSPTLDQAVRELVETGVASVTVMPVFWARAGHVAHDLDPAIEALRAVHAGVRFELLPVLSELPGLLETIATTVASSLDRTRD